MFAATDRALAVPLPGAAPVARRRSVELPERPAVRVRVRTEGDIVAAVLAAREIGSPVRAAGAHGSKNACYGTTGMSLCLDDYDGVLAVDGRRVVAQAGASVGSLNAVLRRHGLALPTHGEWRGATVAGAVATGVHGGSLVHGIMSTSVAAMRLVTADGGVVVVDRGSDLHAHAGVSLGALGVISTITFECVEAFHVELVSHVVPFARYVREHDAAARRHEFYSATWIPSAGRVITYAGDRVREPSRVVPRLPRYSFATLALSALSRRLDVHAFPPRWFSRVVVDTADKILSPIGAGSRHVRFLRALTRHWREAEFAVPLERAGEALEGLDRLVTRHRHALTIPVGLRASPSDRFSLSPCHGRPTFWVAVFFRDRGAFAAELRALFAAMDARSHWGKHLELSPDHLRRQYPGWAAFRAARQRLDPDGVFANFFTRRLGL